MMERFKAWQYLLIGTRNVNANMRNRIARLTLAGEFTNCCQIEFCQKWLSEAKLKARSEASRQITSVLLFAFLA